MKLFKVIISGGGTGGHIFPALAIANELREKNPSIEILFVGAKGKMEMEKVPNAGYKIIGLDVVGIQRSLSIKAIIKNIKFPFLLVKSLRNAKSIVSDFNPDIVIGVGGYASGPTLKMANKLKVPTLIQEQNSYAGLTNKWLSTNASKICVAYDNMEKFFKKDKIIKTGNPIRKDILELSSKIKEAKSYFDLKNEDKVILVLGGSLGAKSINNGLLASLNHIKDKPVRILWQVGSRFHEEVNRGFSQQEFPNVVTMAFIKRMDLAYAAADVIISRAGALSISEITIVGKPSVLVPSPNVSEDHQTKNAMALVEKNAAVLVKDNATNTVIEKAMQLLNDQIRSKLIAENVKKLAKPNATADIVSEIFKLIK